eukprot:gene52110-63702_t
MQTQLAPEYQNTPDGQAAEAILRKCVHCGFCTATCPTYQLLGDELDGPRGRIYLMKQVLEGQTPTRATRSHGTTAPAPIPSARLKSWKFGNISPIKPAAARAAVAALAAADADDAIRAVMITGAGERAFCSGQDLGETAAYGVDDVAAWLSANHRMYRAVRALDKPAVAAFNGT